jgi:hypothetical protein
MAVQAKADKRQNPKAFFRPEKSVWQRRSISACPAVPPPPPPLISEERAVEFMAALTPLNYRKVSCMIGAQLAQMVMPWEVTGPIWALARRKVITELLVHEVNLDEVWFEE